MDRDTLLNIYTGILGKVIGVYMGRPFEGWTHERILSQLGPIASYVAPQLKVPIVVADDDISGTLTFIRALEDSGQGRHTPAEFFGDTWLNYLLERDTILWWGGFGVSTEHTAYVRLRQGHRAPQSGSIALNGRIVAEQIGAQIFIEGCGLVAGGDPALAADLARRAASVSHDGEAVNGAVVVAAMVAAAFHEKDMERLLDLGVSLIPQDSLIAAIHRDVRAWRRQDNDWRATFQRIKSKYGYHRYGGNCHIIPNHAVMVMAWSYAPDSFLQAQTIVNSAGWDTDCNAANVGSVMALVVGLDRLCEDYDFRAPIADRILLPTADGTNAITDCWNEARRMAAIAAAVRGERTSTEPVPAVWMDFAAPGAVHGFMPEDDRAATADNPDGHGLRITLRAATASVATPVAPDTVSASAYRVVGTPKLYPGMTVTLRVEAPASVTATPFVAIAGQTADAPCWLSSGASVTGSGEATLTVPDTAGAPVVRLGLRVDGPVGATLTVRSVQAGGHVALRLPRLSLTNGTLPGWLVKADTLRGPFSDDPEPFLRLISNGDPRFAVIGNRWWLNVTLSAHVSVHSGDCAGIIALYQGAERYLSLTRRGDRLVLALRHYGETILDATDVHWPFDETHTLRLEVRGSTARAFLDGTPVLEAQHLPFSRGAAGLLAQCANAGFSLVGIDADAAPVL